MASPAGEWVVWSFEHNAWWGPQERGYVTRLMWAGLYTEAQAKEIEAGANRMASVPKEVALHITDGIKKEMLDTPCPWGERVGDVMVFPMRASPT